MPKASDKKAAKASHKAASSPASGDLEILRHLIELLEGSVAASIKLSRGDASYEVTKFPGALVAAAAPHQHLHGVYLPPPAAGGGAPSAPGAPGAPAAAPAAPPSNLIEIKSPMVGTFYRSPEPGAEPYVRPGARVSVGQTLCIIEAMKIMNEIESEISGTVRDVLVEDAQPVEFGQVLFRVEPHA